MIGYATTLFSWQYFYYTLTNEGIEYLRDYLHLPLTIVPKPLLKQAKPVGVLPTSRTSENTSENKREYRRKDEKAQGDWKPEFVNSN